LKHSSQSRRQLTYKSRTILAKAFENPTPYGLDQCPLSPRTPKNSKRSERQKLSCPDRDAGLLQNIVMAFMSTD